MNDWWIIIGQSRNSACEAQNQAKNQMSETRVHTFSPGDVSTKDVFGSLKVLLNRTLKTYGMIETAKPAIHADMLSLALWNSTFRRRNI